MCMLTDVLEDSFQLHLKVETHLIYRKFLGTV